MKKILLIATGGTIASKSTETGLSPLILSEELLTYVPDVKKICDIDTIQLLNIDSTSITPEHWLLMEKTIEEKYETYDGFVLCHGTDTMAYTSAALSYLIQNTKKPIVITGSQRPIDMEITDAKTNLTDSILYACDEESSGVNIVFDGKVIAGTRARKMRTKSYNAFSSIDFPSIAIIQNGTIIRYIKEPCVHDKPSFYNKLNSNIFLLKLIPGMDSDILDCLSDKYDGIIIESFGVGGLPSYDKDDFQTRLKQWVDKGKAIVMATQVPHEGSDMTIYKVGYGVKEGLKIMETYDLTLESTVTKLMWAMGQETDLDSIRNLFYSKVNYDLLLVEN